MSNFSFTPKDLPHALAWGSWPENVFWGFNPVFGLKSLIDVFHCPRLKSGAIDLSINSSRSMRLA